MTLVKAYMWVASVLLIGALSFGGLVHALLPHEHTTHGGIDLLHTAFRDEHTKFIDVLTPSLVSVVAIFAAPLLFLPRLLRLQAIRAREAMDISQALRRGVLAYRRFG